MTLILSGQQFATHLPKNPTVNQTEVVDGTVYQWNGFTWKEVGTKNVQEWTPDYRLYAAGSFVTHDDSIWRATVATTSIPGEDATWEKASMTSAEVLALISSSLSSGSLSASSVTTANWTITQIGSDIVFSYNGVKRVKITPAGIVTASDDVVAFGSV